MGASSCLAGRPRTRFRPARRAATFAPSRPLPSTRAGAAAFVDGGAVYLIGGESGVETPSDAILRYDPATRGVKPAGQFIEPLAGAGYVQTGGSLLLVGGWTGETYATAVLRFTLPDDAALVARLPEALRDPAVPVPRQALRRRWP